MKKDEKIWCIVVRKIENFSPSERGGVQVCRFRASISPLKRYISGGWGGGVVNLSMVHISIPVYL